MSNACRIAYAWSVWAGPSNTNASPDTLVRQPEICNPTPIRLKQTKFNMMNYVDCMRSSGLVLEVVERDKAVKADELGLDPASFLSSSISVMEFWYERKNRFPMLYKVAHRALATPVSSSSSERVFSTLKTSCHRIDTD